MENDEDEKTTFSGIQFDDETVAMLIELSEATHCEPKKLIASIVRDVLVDDVFAHGQIKAETDTQLLH